MEEEFSEFSELGESVKTLKHKLGFKDLLCHLCLYGTVLASLSLTQEVVGLRLTLY